MSRSNSEGVDSSSDRLPHEPTRESSRGTGDLDEARGQPDQPAGLHNPQHLGSGRQDVPGESGTDRDPPHSTPQDASGQVHDELPSPRDVPVQPSNASGVDKVTVDEQDEEIDEESMYDRRPERDKDRPPSER
jgi:hypothetical protein